MWAKYYVENYVTNKLISQSDSIKYWSFEQWQLLYQRDPYELERLHNQLLSQ